MANPHMSADKELFLDILTKEEREALLTKKMEEIRKKNEALRKRHEEIEADKRQAEKMVKPGSPKKEIKTVEFNTGKKEEIHRYSGSDFDYLRIRTDFEMTPTVDSLVLPDVKFHKKLPFESEVKRRQRPPGRGKGPGGRGKERPKSLDENGGLHPEPPFRNRRSLHATIPGGGGGHRLERVATMPDEEMNEIHIQITGNVPEHRSSFANSRQIRDKHRDRERERPADVNGPPPDPAYNFLADKRREGPVLERGDRDSGGGGGGGSSGRGGRGGGGGGGNTEDGMRDSGRQKDYRRHPKNYGGSDFQNVKTKMKIAREKQVFTGSSPQSKMEMSISMTGRERRQYMEWKAERERVDKERIDRQKSASGEWRREWDAEKIPQDFEEGSSGKRQELNRRPAGRIGSGRFDRGERDDRQRGDAPGSKENAELKRTKVGEKTEKSKKLLGRGRGRGRGISATPRNRVLPPNLANDSRKVECTRDLLVVKIDNSPGARDDVEVEYSDTDAIVGKSSGSSSAGIAIPACQTMPLASSTSSYSKSCPTHSSTAPAEKMWGTIQENSWDHSRVTKQNGERPHEEDDDDDDDVMLEDEYIEDGELYEGMYEDAENDPHYALMPGMAARDEWDEGAEDVEYYADGNDLVYDDIDKAREPLRVECQLNPEAPAFVPTSPELTKSPEGDDDNIKWVSEIAPNISKSSGSNNNNDEIPKDPIDNCCSNSLELSSSTIVDGKDKVLQDVEAVDAAPSSSSTSSVEFNPCKDGLEPKSPMSPTLEADPEVKEHREGNDTKPTNPNSNESAKTMSTCVSDDDDEFKDTEEIFDEDHSKKDNNNDNMEQSFISESNNNNNNNNNDKSSKDNNINTDSTPLKTNTIPVEENIEIQNNNACKNLGEESSKDSEQEEEKSKSEQKTSAEDESKLNSSDAVRSVTVRETIQTVKDAGAWKLSVRDDVDPVSLYKNNPSDTIESNSLDRSVNTEGSGKSLASELMEAEFGKNVTASKTAAHTTMTSTSSSSSSSATNQPVSSCQDSAPDGTEAQTINIQSTDCLDGGKNEQLEVSDLSNAVPTKAEASV